MTEKQQKALAALLSQPTKEKAAEVAGICSKTLSRYLEDQEFLREYKRASLSLVDDATRQIQRSMSSAIIRLRRIVESDDEATTNHIQAARALLEYGLRYTEFADILRELEEVEGEGNVL